MLIGAAVASVGLWVLGIMVVAQWSPGEEFGEAVGQWKKSVKAAAEFSKASVKL
jgi:hypothetical protein